MNCTTAWQDEIQISRSEEKSADAPISVEKTDFQLVELVLSGDEAAFEDIFDRYKRLVAAIASRYFRRPEQIEEIIQISFSKVYFELKCFRGEHDFSFAGWLGKITTNVCLDSLRTQRRKPENLLCELSEPETEILFSECSNNEKTVEHFLAQRDLAEKLLSNLKAEDRAILQMLDAEELSVGEVAQITGWSNSKIKVRAFRARNSLRKILQKFL
ncbi:MAG TPA: sigma-70 family RNA polymerase sigma factor [Pyrinomonadaceae bacterium]|jgi:RNA polymerase sigma-70 factor (ECF subfamily)